MEKLKRKITLSCPIVKQTKTHIFVSIPIEKIISKLKIKVE